MRSRLFLVFLGCMLGLLAAQLVARLVPRTIELSDPGLFSASNHFSFDPDVAYVLERGRTHIDSIQQDHTSTKTAAVKSVALVLYPLNPARRVLVRWVGDDQLPEIRASPRRGGEVLYVLGNRRPIWDLPDAAALRATLTGRYGLTVTEVSVPAARCKTCEPLTLLRIDPPSPARAPDRAVAPTRG